MQNEKISKKKITLIALLLFALILVRGFESSLFYDPFVGFFHGENQHKPLPSFNGFHLFCSLIFRYLINSSITVLILFLLFKDLSIVKLTSVLLFFFFIVLSSVFFLFLNFSTNPDYLLIFYLRRFLIQPLFLILFVPAFFYQKSVTNK